MRNSFIRYNLDMACQVQLQSESRPLFRRVSYSSLSSCGSESILFVSSASSPFSIVVSLAATASVGVLYWRRV